MDGFVKILYAMGQFVIIRASDVRTLSLRSVVSVGMYSSECEDSNSESSRV